MLILQDPTNDKSTTLLESISEALKSASSLSAMFSFVSKSGVDLITKESNFHRVASSGGIDLIVGVDAVTNAKAIDALVILHQQYPQIRIRALMNPKPSGLFHPKFAFTEANGGGFQITGSGNLTEGGLLRHWEAYSFDRLDARQLAETKLTFDGWVGRHSASLLRIEDPLVRDRAQKNTVSAVIGDLPTLIAHPDEDKDEDTDAEQVVSNDARVLIAQIPKSGNRWNQANFDIDNFRDFFGVGDDVAKRLWVFRYVNHDGTMAEYEPLRPPVPVASDNFRFELKAAAGQPYPTGGRPIGVFVRMAARLYFYRLLMPNDDPQFSHVLALLRAKAGQFHRPDRMMRERMTVGELKTLWPDSPFWKLPPID